MSWGTPPWPRLLAVSLVWNPVFKAFIPESESKSLSYCLPYGFTVLFLVLIRVCL